MADKLKVAWFNGLNIDKIHFEQQERYLQRYVDVKTIGVGSNLYGIIDIEFSRELLIEGKIALTKISGISKDGSVFDAPQQDLLPEPLELKYDSLVNSIITLKIPLGFMSVADIALLNNMPDTKYIALKSMIGSRIYDETNQDIIQNLEDVSEQSMTFTQEKISLSLASLRLKLGILGDSTTDELELPIAKIKSIDNNKKIELDESFIPTCLDISKNSVVKAFLEEILYSIKSHKEILGNIFKGIDQTKNTLDFSTYLALNLLKKYYLIFSYLNHKDKLHPEFLYEKLVEFQGELGIFNTEGAFLEFIPYKHQNLNESFIPLMNNIRILFAKITSPRYTMANVTSLGNGFYDMFFDNAGIVEEADIFLAISADASYEYLLQNFKSQSKLYTQSKIKNIVATQLKGINIEQIPNIPSALPYLNGYIYYKIDKKDPLFADFKGANVISLYLTHNIKNPDIKMWAVF
ncbi:type VI secretion system baseplate subunit TssK [Campylobacter helveticus]|uniref:Type VI secretion system baseplate subunit TssK n=1 Tax=Campylobacter helveticus TaxID=28898 RepID=A0AAX2UHB2_9BACT|nr:type VI secretion system baseplate subunit TssK [Campylobacter helveticus]ARE80312.1 type VI secretion system, membrane platform protein [Campylobacter helveticus]MCR2055457.1 type VI secretion system baseplate subunit TssK [Campylobacter helveticus]TNB55547.1 type VI secretion system baseplate subunit TssK [Campylobacter helveticus]TNB55560.1 type VI secretion system baseplate subunit TssK [Campylobacter helveticus]TNH32139.1 type VI secretion system baseplate subunit TssK [Campylobacter h